jgi:hypothetical protein
MNNKAWGWTQRQDYVEAWPSCGLAKELAELAYTRVSGEAHNEVDLMVTIFIEQAKDKNLEFFDSIQFEKRCTLIGLDPELVKRCVYKVGQFDVN